jgi:hypothetical protein
VVTLILINGYFTLDYDNAFCIPLMALFLIPHAQGLHSVRRMEHYQRPVRSTENIEVTYCCCMVTANINARYNFKTLFLSQNLNNEE